MMREFNEGLNKTISYKASLVGANLYGAFGRGKNLRGADFTCAYMKGAIFWRTTATSCLFRQVTAKNCMFIETDLRKSDFHFAELLGARFNGAKTDLCRNMDTAQYEWWMSPWRGPQSYKPRPGWDKIDSSLLGNISFRENSASEFGTTK